uniref:helix-turn-helix domain-containing protein n=1 Tax=Streptomyces atratus TaxID=1893 RepID=UPI002AC31FA6|nr:helix-turn-helix domain-containing protein [Streptomyces atratus]
MIPAVCRRDAVSGGWGLTAERRAFREQVRLEAGRRFAAGEKTAVIAKELRVSERSVERWRRAWREGGPEALRSAEPAKVPRISDAQFAVLEEELGKGPAAHGFEDQRWTLGRVQAVLRCWWVERGVVRSRGPETPGIAFRRLPSMIPITLGGPGP